MQPAPATTPPRLLWDVFCRVVDNHGDLGVCWRLARRLVALGHDVRLWIDEPRALRWMAPTGTLPTPGRAVRFGGIELHGWEAPAGAMPIGDVIVETFGADLPEGWLARMAGASPTARWIDVEYLSAEPYVERSHGLPSPQSQGPGTGLTRWFFYPGFNAKTGGLLLSQADPAAGLRLLQNLGVAPSAGGTQTVSLYGYAQPQLDAAVAHWRARPTQLLACPGPAADQLAAQLGVAAEAGSTACVEGLVVHWLPWLAQPDYDTLLGTCDLNLVRGEDSFVQALACGKPFMWQLYPQDDGAHATKLDAFLGVYLATAPAGLAQALRRAFRGWNGFGAFDLPEAGPASPWRHHADSYTRTLHAEQAGLGDLALRLERFVRSRP